MLPAQRRADPRASRTRSSSGTLGQLARFLRTHAKLIPVSRAHNHDGSLSGPRDTPIPTASAFGALVTTDSLDPRRACKSADSGNVCTSRSPTPASACDRCARSRSASTASSPRDVPAGIGITMAALLPTGQHPLMTFRIGHPTATALRSPRRPADDVLLR